MGTEREGAGAAPGAAEVRAWLVARVAEEHGCAPEDVPLETPLQGLGLSSIELLTLTGDLAGFLGCALPGDLFWNLRTVAEVAACYGVEASSVPRAGSGPASAQLVTLQQAGAGEPLYLVHSIAGEVVCWQDLAHCFASERPVFALQQPDATEAAAAGVEELAERYARCLLDHRPEGNFCLAGHCYGARVAFELARRLEATGRKVSFLGILEGLPGPRPRVTASGVWRALPRIARNLPAWLRDNLAGASAAEVVRRCGRGLVALRKSLARTVLGVSDPGLSAHFADASIPAQYAQRYNTNLATWSRYAPGEYAGRVTLFRSRRREVYQLLLDDDGGWSRHARAGVETRTVPGSHDDMIFAPHAGSLASALRDAIERAA